MYEYFRVFLRAPDDNPSLMVVRSPGTLDGVQESELCRSHVRERSVLKKGVNDTMKTLKMGIILLAFLLAAMVTVPMVNGDTITSAASARAISAVSLPQLQVNNSQPIMVVTGELSPGKSVLTTTRTAPQNTKEVSIPFGAIIRHANNMTTVFDQNGQQMFMADDSQAEKISALQGVEPGTFVHEVPNASVIIDGGDTLQVIHNNARILTIINSNSPESFAPTSTITCFGAPYANSWVEGTESQPISSTTGVSHFVADWNVPTSPPSTTGGGTLPYFPVYIWNGLYYCANGSVKTALIQPVLEWNYPNHNTWNMATWYVWSNSTTMTPPYPSDSIYSSAVSGSIYTNDLIQGNIQVNTAGYDAIGSITDTGPNGYGSSTLWLLKNDPEWNASMPAYAQILLEGGGYYPSPSGSLIQNKAANYTGPITFNNFVLTDKNSNNILQSTPTSSFVDTQWYQYNFTDYNNLSVYNQWPSTIVLLNNPNRVNPPVVSFTGSPRTGSGSDYVIFQDQSTGSPFLWNWSFGDGTFSTSQNPAHYYTSTGSYTVNLTVVGAGGVEFNNQPNYIIVS